MSSSEKQRLEIDRRVLFTALGFIAVTLKGGPAADQSEQVLAMADLIETFCRLHVPEAFEDDAAPVDNSKRDSMVEAIADILKTDGRCSPHELQERFSDDDIERYWEMAYRLACVSLNFKRRLS